MRQRSITKTPRLIIEELAHPSAANHLRRPTRRTYTLGGRHTAIRDAIIENVRHDFPDAPFTAPFIAHLLKIGYNKLDIYSEIVFELSEHNVNLTFRATRDEPEEMLYTLSDLTLEPDPRLAQEIPAPSSTWARWRPW
jgi:hypothetical protein